MEKNKSGFRLAALILAIFVLLAGCGNAQNSGNGGGNAGETANSSGGASNNAGGTANGGSGQQEQTGENTEKLSGVIVALGSSAMQPLVEEAAKRFMSKHPDVKIQVQGGGSGTGLSQVSSGGAHIGNSDIFAEEKEGIDASALVDHKVAIVGMAAVAHPEVGVDNLTKQQLIDIFTGKITNWKEVGGADQEITLVNRPKSSGTRATFFKYALDENEEKEGITEDSSGTVRKIIAETKGAIGYLAFSYFDNSVKPLALDGVQPTVENVHTNAYPVWAYQHMYTKGEPDAVTKAFLDFMLSDEIQKSVVVEMGYIPVTDMKVERSVDGNITNK